MPPSPGKEPEACPVRTGTGQAGYPIPSWPPASGLDSAQGHRASVLAFPLISLPLRQANTDTAPAFHSSEGLYSLMGSLSKICKPGETLCQANSIFIPSTVCSWCICSAENQLVTFSTPVFCSCYCIFSWFIQLLH